MAPPGRADWTYFSLSSLPRPLDIVWCRFPTRNLPARPGPKPRPALVRSVLLNSTHTRARVEITYGTSNLKADLRPLDLIVQGPAELRAMGLPQPTRFDLDLTVVVPWASEFFEPLPGKRTPIVGHLTDAAIAQLEALKVVRRKGLR